jgi:hypothetical protein
MIASEYNHQRPFGLSTNVAASSAFEGQIRDRPDVEKWSFMLTTTKR